MRESRKKVRPQNYIMQKKSIVWLLVTQPTLIEGKPGKLYIDRKIKMCIIEGKVIN